MDISIVGIPFGFIKHRLSMVCVCAGEECGFLADG